MRTFIAMVFLTFFFFLLPSARAKADTQIPSEPIAGQSHVRNDELSALHYCFHKVVLQNSRITYSAAGINSRVFRECGHLVWMMRSNPHFFDHGHSRIHLSVRIPTCISNPLSEKITGNCVRGVFFDCILHDGRPLCPSQLGLDTQITGLNWNRNRLVPRNIPSEYPLGHRRARFIKVNGQIPDGFGRFTGIRFIDMGNQYLTGTLPSDWGALVQLEQLRISNAQLTGTIPSSYSGMTKLHIVDLSNNNLRGTLPAGFGGSSNSLNYMHSINLANNEFSGTLPTLLGDYQTLRNVNLSGNNFSGSLANITATFRSGSVLEKLDLSDNDFTGQFPAAIKTLARLKELRLGDNNFSGCLPTDWQNWSALKDRADLKNASGAYLPDCGTSEGAGHAAPQKPTINLYLPLVRQ